MPRSYYNEFDPGAAEWLRELIRAGHIPEGDVDERSIAEVRPADIVGYRSVHFFAGIGGWAYAIRLAGWPDDRPVWTGSCPCQPYSAAGKGLGDKDPRNLWPHMFRLVRECGPDVIFGEQVEGAVRHGWLDGICADLEGEGYAVGSAILGAHSVGAPHIRQRLYWVADARGERRQQDRRGPPRHEAANGGAGRDRGEPDGDHLTGGCCSTGGLGDAEGVGRSAATRPGEAAEVGPTDANARGNRELQARPVGSGGLGSWSGDAIGPGPQGLWPGVRGEPGDGGGGKSPAQAGDSDFWSAYDIVPCRDGKARRTEPGSFPLAHGLPGRVGLLRGYGNAICPQTAATFIQAWLEVEGEA